MRYEALGHVLIIEFNAIVASALAREFEQVGWEVIGPFTRAAQANDTIGERRIDLAVFNIGQSLSDMENALTKTLRTRGTRIIATSDCRDVVPQADLTIAKPYDMGELAAISLDRHLHPVSS